MDRRLAYAGLMARRWRRTGWKIGIGMATASAALLAAFAVAPLRTFNALMPADGGVVLAERGAAYGPHARQRLDLYRPVAAGADARLPVIVFFYGGSWNSGMREGYGFVARALAAAGFLVAVPDYRLVPEVGYPVFLEDGAAAVHWLRGHVRRHGGDPDRIILAGHSAGAYNAAMLALDPRWLGGDHVAVRGLIGMAGPYDFLPLDSPVTIAAFGRWPRLEETQPIVRVAAGAPPALLLHGAEDETVRPANARLLAQAIEKAGGQAQARLYPGVGHVGVVTALARPFRGRAPVLADIVAFAHDVTK